jgi:hypothetical protein
MSFAKCFTFNIGKGPTLYKELNERDYNVFSTALSTIEMAELEMYYAELLRTGYHILSSISPDELQKTKDKFYIAEYNFASWLNCFQIWRAFHEKNYKEIFNPLAHSFYDNYNEYKLACVLRTTFTHMPCGPLSFVFDVLQETSSINLNISNILKTDKDLKRKEIYILEETLNKYGERFDILKFSAEANKVFESFQSEIWSKMTPGVNKSFKIIGKHMPLNGSDCYNSYIEFENGSEEINVGHIVNSFIKKSQLYCLGFIL